MTLLDAVDALTKERIEHLAQKDDNGKWLKAHTVTHPALLAQFRDTASPTAVNNGAGNSALPSERNMLDLNALYEYAKIASQINDWCHIAHVKPTKDPVESLRRWYSEWAAHQTADLGGWESILRRWEAQINLYFDPPKKFTIPKPCPVCGTTGYGDAINGGGLWPIEVSYWLTEEGDIDRATEKAVCRRCEPVTVWQGHESVMELAEELNEAG